MRTLVRIATGKSLLVVVIVTLGISNLGAQTVSGTSSERGPVEYRVLATNRTSTMDKELNEAAEAGFQFRAVMGGETAFGGSEVVVVMSRSPQAAGRFAYRLLATNRTSTMQKEIQEAADAGYEYRGQTVFKSAFGGEEVVCILERDNDAKGKTSEYRLLATSRTATLQNELLETGAAGFEVVGMTVAQTALGGKELVVIARRARLQ
jgi:hypothetical protein